MVETLVGAGGWGYFSGSLVPYARAFGFVELNATFYRKVTEATARRWRASVPASFTFAVKVHQEVTHRARLRGTPAAVKAFAQTARVARILRASFLILEAPASLALGPDELGALEKFAAMTPDGIHLGLEARAYATGPLPVPVTKTLEASGILDVVDLSRATPRVEADVVYTRIFGKGTHNVYEFDDDELREIDRAGRDAATVAYAFHGVRMYKDAARFLTFRRTGSFPPATGALGLDSLAEVLAPDARFPSDRDALLRDHGWKVIDIDVSHRAHASAILANLPAGEYNTLDGLLGAAERSGALARMRGRPGFSCSSVRGTDGR